MDFRINIGYLRNCSCILPETLIFSHMNRMSLLINTYVHNHNYMIKKTSQIRRLNLAEKKKNKKIYTHKVVLKSRVEINLKNERRL